MSDKAMECAEDIIERLNEYLKWAETTWRAPAERLERELAQAKRDSNFLVERLNALRSQYDILKRNELYPVFQNEYDNLNVRMKLAATKERAECIRVLIDAAYKLHDYRERAAFFGAVNLLEKRAENASQKDAQQESVSGEDCDRGSQNVTRDAGQCDQADQSRKGFGQL